MEKRTRRFGVIAMRGPERPNRKDPGRGSASLVVVAVLVAAMALVIADGESQAANADRFPVELSSEAVTPDAGPAGASGTALILSYVGRDEICVDMSVRGLPLGDRMTGAGLYLGDPGQVGVLVVELFSGRSSTEPIFECSTEFDRGLPGRLLAEPGRYYLQAASEQHPTGALRGQLGPSSSGVSCPVTIQPSTVGRGQAFTVSGEFGGYAEVYLVVGHVTELPPTAEPLATVPSGVSPIAITLRPEPDQVGPWTVWVNRPATRGCAGSAFLTILAATPAPGAAPATPTSPGDSQLGAPVIVGVAVLIAAAGATAFLVRRRGATSHPG